MKKKQPLYLWERLGYASQSAYHRSKKRARGVCQIHGCSSPVRVKIVNGKVVHTYSHCAQHATRKSRGFK